MPLYALFMSQGRKETAKHPLADLPEKHRNAFIIAYFALMGLTLVAGAVAHFIDESKSRD